MEILTKHQALRRADVEIHAEPYVMDKQHLIRRHSSRRQELSAMHASHFSSQSIKAAWVFFGSFAMTISRAWPINRLISAGDNAVSVSSDTQ
jgi:hypothetical protein